MQEEIFGPVIVAMTFRTPDEAVALANNTRYGLAASVWSETIGLALDIAPKLQAGVVWINATNLFDAAVGFGGYRESGFGREGGREGCYEYLKPKAWADRKPRKAVEQPQLQTAARWLRCARARPHRQAVHRRQAGAARRQLFPRHRLARRQAGGRSRRRQPQGHPQRRRRGARRRGLVAAPPAHNRAQILYYIAENLSARARRIRRPHRRHDRRVRRQCESRGRGDHQPPVHLRRLGRQVRGRGAFAAAARRGARA